MSIHGFQLHWQPIANNKLNPILTVTTTYGLTVITFEERIWQHSYYWRNCYNDQSCSRYHHRPLLTYDNGLVAFCVVDFKEKTVRIEGICEFGVIREKLREPVKESLKNTKRCIKYNK